MLRGLMFMQTCDSYEAYESYESYDFCGSCDSFEQQLQLNLQVHILV